jgi:BclA C-terminal domain
MASFALLGSGVAAAACPHPLPPSSPTITLVNRGIYKVTYSVSATALSQMTLFINGVAVAGTTYGSGAGTQQNTGQGIINAAPGDVLTLVNHTTTAAVDLATPIGGTAPTTNASILIEKLG